jgi:hypothetical protein
MLAIDNSDRNARATIAVRSLSTASGTKIMTRRFLLTLANVAGIAAFGSTPVLAQATTTRIETRPFYGATVTLEEGVRVFRPLPPHGHVIINPGNRTFLNLNVIGERTLDVNAQNYIDSRRYLSSD